MQPRDEVRLHHDTPTDSDQSSVPRRTIRRLSRRVLVLPAFTALVVAFFTLLLGHAPAAYASPAQAPPPPTDLYIVKTGPLTATVGGQVVFDILIGNASFVNSASNITVTDPAPAGLVFVGFGGACSGATCNIASLSNLSTKSIKVTYTIPSNFDILAHPYITNTAYITAANPDPIPSNNRGTTILPTGLVSIADLVLTKTASSNLVARGENVTYTLQLANIGPSNAISVSMLDLMTPTLPFASGTSSDCTFAPVLTGTIILCNNLPASSNFVVTAVYTVPLDWVTTTVTNTGLAGSFSLDPNIYNNVASRTITITSRADVSITKDAPAQVVPGTDAVFTLTVKNLGPSKANTVTVSDPGFNSLTPAVGAPCAGGFPCNIGTLFPLSSTQIVLTFTVPSSLTDTQVVNTASVTSVITDEVSLNNSSTVTVPVVRISDLDIAKDGPESAVPGQLITYTVVVTNNGPSDAAEVTLTDLDPISLTAQGSPCVAGVCSLPDLPAGVSTTLQLTYLIDPFALGTITNTASVTSTGAATPVTDTAQTLLTPQFDLSIHKTDGLDSAYFGTPLTYTIVVSNSGPSGVDGAIISDTMPALLGGVSWTCAANAPDTCAPASGTGDISTTLRLAPNGVVTITAGGLLTTSFGNPPQTTTLANTATVITPDGLEEDGQNNSSTDQTDLSYSADVFITKTATPSDTIAPGEMMTYVLVVGNAGPSRANNAKVTDWVYLSGAQWTCIAGDNASCNTASGIGSLDNVTVTLEPNSFVTFTITGTVYLGTSGSLYNGASVQPNAITSDPNTNNNDSWVDVPIQWKAFVGIGKSNGQTIAVPGTMVTYVITLSNEGPNNANGMLYDIFPPELQNPVWAWTYAGKAMVMGDINNIVASPGVTVEMYPHSSLTVTVSGTLQLTATGWLTNEVNFAIGNDNGGNCEKSVNVAPAKFINECGDPRPIINTNPITRAVDVDEIVPAQVTGKIFNDMDGNGLSNAGEPPLLGVQVVITGNGVGAVTVTVDANGMFTATVPPGPFSLSVVQASVPAGFVLTSNNDQKTGNAVAGANWMGYIGYQGRGAVNGVVFNDINGNSVQDAGENGLPNVSVSLTPVAAMNIASVDGAIVAITTTTDASGNYTFTNVPAANYALNAVVPNGFVNTTPLPQDVNVTPASNTSKNIGMQSPGVLVITKQAQTNGSGNVLGVDRLVTFTLSITNTGGGLLSGVVITDALESYLQYVAGSATPAPASTTPMVWQVGDLQPGQSTSVRFTTKVSAGFGGTVVNTAKTDSALTEQVLSNEIVIHPAPTAITLLWLTAQREGDGVQVEWATGSERDTYGFNIMRSETGNRADATQVNAVLIPAGAKDGRYTFIDGSADAGKIYTYWLQEVELSSGNVIDYPQAATVQPATGQGMTRYNVFVPAVIR